MNTSAEIKLWGTTIGLVTHNDGDNADTFEYTHDFSQSGIEVSPIQMPLKTGVYKFYDLPPSFHGLPGLLADSLPDKFGNAMIETWLAKQGRLTSDFNEVERLCYTGTRGMGALEFFPAIFEHPKYEAKIHVQDLVELSSAVLENRKNLKEFLDKNDSKKFNRALSQIITLGTSAGGARAKAVIALNPQTNEIRSGQVSMPEGFESWLIKFSGVSENSDKESNDKAEYGAVEYAYHKMALAAGITMTECRLLDDGKNRHFMTKRFDRISGQSGTKAKLHAQTLAALAHFDLDKPHAYSYEQAFEIMRRLACPRENFYELYRRMIFNILARNQDDHVKNISFLMDRRGNWTLAPAYDVGFAYNPNGAWTRTHQMSVNGKYSDITREDIFECGKFAGIKKNYASEIFGQVSAAVANWKTFGEEQGISGEFVDAIDEMLVSL